MNLYTAPSEYNKESSILIVSSYPFNTKDGLSNVSGVATYTYHMLPSLIKALNLTGRKLIVLADTAPNQPNYQEKGFLLVRCWTRRSFSVFSQIVKAIKRFSRVKKILIHFEFNMYGEAYLTGLLPFYLLWLRLMGKEVTLLMHQVVEDLSELSGHINIKRGSFRMYIYKSLLRSYTKALCLASNKIIVHDEVLKTRIKKIVDCSVFVVPHGLGEYYEDVPMSVSRKYLGIPRNSFVILCFGFVTWYKGSDWIVEKFANFIKKTKDKSVVLVMAGGKSLTLGDYPHYNEFYAKVEKEISNCSNITLTGIVPENEVKYYYNASDVVVMPYRTQMSASGPFAKGIAFERPFLVSNKLSGVLKTRDMQLAMKKFSIKDDDIVFDLDDMSLFKKITKLINNKEEISRLKQLSKEISLSRNWDNTVERFIYALDI